MTAPQTKSRSDFVVEQLSEFNRGLGKADRDLKYSKMGVDAYAFYRGTAHLFWIDFVGDERLARFGDKHSRCWLVGDAHAYNFGAFYSDRFELTYGLNDFDEAVIADYQYDLWRLAVSVVLIARGYVSLDVEAQKRAVTALAKDYLGTMLGYRYGNAERKTVYTEANTRGQLQKFLKAVAKNNSRKKMLGKWTMESSDSRVFDLSNPRLAPVTAAARQTIIDSMPRYGETLAGDFAYSGERFEVLDVACRLNAGTGSLGTPRYYVLIRGAGKKGSNNVILDLKLQGKPAGYAYLREAYRDEYAYLFDNDAQRQFAALRSLSSHPDDYAGYMELPEGWFSVRERSPYKEALPAERLDTEKRMTTVAAQWGAILATQHTFGDNVYAGADFLEYGVGRMAAGKQQEFNALVWEVAQTYADQVQLDSETFVTEFLGGVRPVAR